MYIFLPTQLSSVSPQLKQPDKAAAAAHTYFQANPEHVEMGDNLEQYKDLQGVQEDQFVDREARPHQVDPGNLLEKKKMGVDKLHLLNGICAD